MGRIRILHDTLVSQIAAGEVVERPASVLKELLENALDAGGHELEVDLEAGGRRRIRVSDDGCGMSQDDALLAFDRHATSKITSFDDLEKVATLGFRGEALAAISAVAKVELVTAEAPGYGWRVRIEGGRVRDVEPTARPRGTSVDVAHLFFNVPARRKFLKPPPTELRRCLETAQATLLAHPEIGMVVRHEGRVLVEATGEAPGTATEAGSVAAHRHRVLQLFGRDLAAALVDLDAKGPAGTVRALVGEPRTARGRRQFVFVNGRPVRDRQVVAAFYRAVRDEWRSDEAPALFLWLEVPPQDVDVNVHPQKAEVRFRDPGLLEHVYASLRGALVRARGDEPAPLRPASGPLPAPLAWQGGEVVPVSWPPPHGGAWPAAGGSSPAWTPGSQVFAGSEGAVGEVHEPGTFAAPSTWPSLLPQPSLVPARRGIVPLSGRDGVVRPFRLLGQYKGSLILLEGPDGLYLIDQHVAHERLLYERMRRSLTGTAPATQRLLEPRILALAAPERLRLRDRMAALERAGFVLAELSGDALAVIEAPSGLGTNEIEEILLAAATRDAAGEDPVRALLEALAAGMACKAAVKMHQPLSAPEMEALVTDLFAAEQPYACPHGRPIVLQLGDADLERRFGRR